MKRFDQRLLVCLGCFIFAASCYMNISMSFDYSGDQLRFANIVRAFGQPFTIVPITGLAVATLAAKDAGSGSAIFNIFRNVGGSFGIAILSTLVTRREQFTICALENSLRLTHRQPRLGSPHYRKISSIKVLMRQPRSHNRTLLLSHLLPVKRLLWRSTTHSW